MGLRSDGPGAKRGEGWRLGKWKSGNSGKWKTGWEMAVKNAKKSGGGQGWGGCGLTAGLKVCGCPDGREGRPTLPSEVGCEGGGVVRRYLGERES